MDVIASVNDGSSVRALVRRVILDRASITSGVSDRLLCRYRILETISLRAVESAAARVRSSPRLTDSVKARFSVMLPI